VVVFPSVNVKPSIVIQSAPANLRIPSVLVAVGDNVPTPAFSVTVPPAFTIVTVFVALNTAFSDALPITKPVAGAVSDVSAVNVNVTGPVIAVVAFKAESALARVVYEAARFGVVLVLPVMVTPICALAPIEANNKKTNAALNE
jgi:hypothetical protein